METQLMRGFFILQTYNNGLKQYSRDLRNNMSDAERRIWSRLKSRQLAGCQFYRQKIIGDYIVDFFCPKARLVIEIDGGQHSSGKVLKSDRIRTAFLHNRGLKVMRFTDTDTLNNTGGVVEKILQFLNSRGSGNPP